MLRLAAAHRNAVGVIEQDFGGHELKGSKTGRAAFGTLRAKYLASCTCTEFGGSGKSVHDGSRGQVRDDAGHGPCPL